MPVAFPSLKPAERDYTPPTHAITTLRSQNGTVSRRLWGSKPGNAELVLVFRHITTQVAATIVQAWLDTKSGVDTLVLPSTVFAGMTDALRLLILPTTGSLSWTFAEAPKVTFVGPVWATVTVRLVGELRMN